MRQVEFAPAGIVELRLFGAGHISEMEKPVCIEDPDPEERLVSGRPSCVIKKCYTVIVMTISYTGALSRWGSTNPRRGGSRDGMGDARASEQGVLRRLGC